jgi:PD-(D/E)XK nuclease superfamily protein
VLIVDSSAGSVKGVVKTPLTRKGKGDLAELKVACDLVQRGYRTAFPYGEDNDYDLILLRGDETERVQVKYSAARNGVILVRCKSHSLTNGKIRRTKHYTAEMIDWLAVYEPTTDCCFYVSADELGAGRSEISLRLSPTRNNQEIGIRYAEKYANLS